MNKSNFFVRSVIIVVTLLATGCASVNYIGKTFDPTANVDKYFSKEEIKKEYTVIGHAIGSGALASNEKIQKKLIEEAKLKGADAIIITGLGKSQLPIGENSSIDETQINASFIKYK